MLKSLEEILTSREFVAFLSIATLFGLIATFYSLRLALRSLADSKNIITSSTKVLGRLEALGLSLEDVGRSLTTRRVGVSPDYIPSITKLVSEAKESLQITTILPSIGIFSNPGEWEALESALKERQRQPDFKVHLLMAVRSARETALETLFADAQRDWTRWSTDTENSSKLVDYARRFKHGEPKFRDFRDFVEFSLDLQEKLVKDVFWKATPEQTNEFIPLISWIKDDSEAFFAIANANGKNTGFITRDQNMINSFKSVRDRYKRCERFVG